MHHLFWVYRRRCESESDSETLTNNRREYQALRAMLLGRWPSLRLRTTPAQGAGVRLLVQSDCSASALERFFTECLKERNAEEPTARLVVERARRNAKQPTNSIPQFQKLQTLRSECQGHYRDMRLALDTFKPVGLTGSTGAPAA